jgi:hypothetical protein
VGEAGLDVAVVHPAHQGQRTTFKPFQFLAIVQQVIPFPVK